MLAVSLCNIQEDIGLRDDLDKTKAMSVACAFRAAGHSSGYCAKHTAEWTLHDFSVWCRHDVKVIGLGRGIFPIPLRRSPSGGPRCQVATSVASNVPFPKTQCFGK